LATALAEQLQQAEELVSGLPASGPAALTTLSTYEGRPVSVGMLAAVVALSPSAAVRLVDRLVAAGLAERGKGGDGREVSVSLTAYGREVAAQVRQAREAVIVRAFDSLPGGEVDQLGAALERVLAAMTTGRREARWMCRTCDHGLCHRSGGCPIDAAATALGQ
jgi:DNA-binding MarR family transcriptional regulator